MEVLDAPSMKTFKVRVDRTEQHGLVGDVPAHCRAVGTRWPLKVPSNQNHSDSFWTGNIVKGIV